MPSPLRFLLPCLGLAAVANLTGCATSSATAPATAAATPPLTSGAAAQALYAQWFAPRTAQVLQSAQQWQTATDAYCSGKADIAAPRQQFAHTAQNWDRTAAVAIGPQIERRSARMVDFQPMRLPLLKTAMRKAPANLAAMESVGAPAKGLPVAEHLLWTEIAAPNSPQCHYLQLVVADAVQELQHLHHATQAATTSAALDFEINAEFLNQWIGGIERLRWASMDKPLRSATPSKPAQLTRAASQGTIASWNAQWSSLRALAIGSEQLSIVQLVEARGWERLGGELRQAVAAVDRAMQAVDAPTLSAIAPAVKAMGQLKHLVENDVALALDITIGFSDADGD